MDQPPPRSVPAPVVPLAARRAEASSQGPSTTPVRPSLVDDLRHRAPAVWSSVRSHPSVRAATDRAAGWTGTDRLRAVTRTAATARTALAALSGNRGGADSRPLADVVPLRPRPGRRGDTSGGHLAVVIDLADHRARRRRFEPGSA